MADLGAMMGGGDMPPMPPTGGSDKPMAGDPMEQIKAMLQGAEPAEVKLANIAKALGVDISPAGGDKGMPKPPMGGGGEPTEPFIGGGSDIRSPKRSIG